MRLLTTLALFAVLFASVLLFAFGLVWLAMAVTHKTFLPNLWPGLSVLLSLAVHLALLRAVSRKFGVRRRQGG